MLEAIYLCVSVSELRIIWAAVFIATDLGIPVPDSHALINLQNNFAWLEKRNSNLPISLLQFLKVRSSPNSPFNRFLITTLLNLVISYSNLLTLLAIQHASSALDQEKNLFNSIWYRNKRHRSYQCYLNLN